MLKPGALGLADLLELMEHQAQQGAVGIRLCLCSSLHKTETSLIPLPKTRSAKGEGLFLQLQREGVKSPKCVLGRATSPPFIRRLLYFSSFI